MRVASALTVRVVHTQDIGKVADLVLLLIDASFGFEMETFEFLNILQVCAVGPVCCPAVSPESP